ncbi:MAG: hypothetical protein ACTSPY_13385 [Candidatus Helarchaeota archaeon]
MSFNPFDGLIEEMKSKMRSIIPDIPYIGILDSNGKKYYFDEKLNERKDIIEDFNKNLNIQIGQYSLPISAPLGFFRISENILVVIYLETGQSGNLLLFQGIINNYSQKIQEYFDNIHKMSEIEASAFKIIRLKKREIPKSPEEFQCPFLRQQYQAKKFAYNEGLVLKLCDGTKTISEIIKTVKLPRTEILSIINMYKDKGWIEIVTTIDEDQLYSISSTESAPSLLGTKEVADSSEGDIELFPFLLDKYKDRRFSFEEGQIIQFCDGSHNIKQIAEMTKKSETEVLDVVNKYQLKGWLDILQK